MKEKKYATILVVVFLISFMLNFITLPKEMSSKAEMLKNSSVSEFLSEEQIAGMANPSSGLKAILSFWKVFLLLLKISIAGFFLYLLFGIAGVDGTYLNFFTLAVGGALIGNVLPQILYTISTLSQVNLIQFSRLSFLMPSLAPKSLMYQLLIQLDVFVLWYAIAVGLGVTTYSSISTKKSLAVSFSFVLFKSFVMALFAYFMLKIAGN